MDIDNFANNLAKNLEYRRKLEEHFYEHMNNWARPDRIASGYHTQAKMFSNDRLVRYALDHMGIQINDKMLQMADEDRYGHKMRLDAIARGLNRQWRRTVPLERELVRSAIMVALDDAKMPRCRIEFVSGLAQMASIIQRSGPATDFYTGRPVYTNRHDRLITRPANTSAWWGDNSGSQGLADALNASAPHLDGVCLSWNRPNDILSTFCHAWAFVRDDDSYDQLGPFMAQRSQFPSPIMPGIKIIVCDYPTVLKLDKRDRAHCEDGPAIKYADGTRYNAWHGIRLEDNHIERNYTYKDILKEPNSEVRRAMVELYGAEKYIKDSGATCQQSDECGKLWRMPVDPVGEREERMRGWGGGMTGGMTLGMDMSLWVMPRYLAGWQREPEQIVFVEVLNSTPEPDGSTRTYYLRVPPATKTAREGVAWTFNVAPQDYEPQQQT